MAKHGRAGFLLASGGLACAAALVPAAFLAPVYSGETSSSDGAVVHTTNTLVGVNGLWIGAGLMSVPLFLALVIWIGLRLRCSRGSVLASRVAWVAVFLLWAFTLVGALSIGFLVLPSALLLVVAAKTTPWRASPAPA
jgi:hypothetical protein